MNDLELSLKYAEELIALAETTKNSRYLSKGFIQKGNKNRLLGNLENALAAYFKGTEAAIAAKSIKDEGVASLSIADVYSEMGNSENAQNYYSKAIDLLRKTNDSISLATALINAGDEALKNQNYEYALTYFKESGAIFKDVDYLIGTAYNLGNVGMVYAEQGKDGLAETNMSEAITILEELNDYYPICVYLTYISDIYLRKNDFQTALSYAEKSFELAKYYGIKDQISEGQFKTF